MIHCLIIDDEPLAIEVLETHLSHFDDLHLVGKCSNAMEANKLLEKEQIDLMFLDIHMPKISGIEFLKTLKNPPLVILTTAHQEFAMEGYELDVIDYLLKPISLKRLMKAISKVKERVEISIPSSQPKNNDYFFVKADKKLLRINYDDIIYIEGLKDYVMIHLKSKRVVTLQTMKHLEEHLKAYHFTRVHRSFIVNTNKISAISGQMLELLLPSGVKLIPIGKNYRDKLIELINNKRI